MSFSNFLAVTFRATFVRYMKANRIAIYHQEMLSSLMNLKKNDAAGETSGITLLVDPNRYILSEENFLLIIQVAVLLTVKKDKYAVLHVYSSYRKARALLVALHDDQLLQKKGKLLTLSLFLDANILQAKLISHSNSFVFVSTMRTIDYKA